jgi:two-component system, chemotaxis family, response regulator Rcp1
MNTPLAESGRPAEILHVEDDDGFADLTNEVFKRTKLGVRIHRVRNGEECLAFLRKEAPYADAPFPDMMLLDLNMPRMDGHEVLEEICRDEKLRHLPVLILTTSKDEQEVLKMYRLRCNSYIVKKIDFSQFRRTIEVICDYWLRVVVLPTAHRSEGKDV